MVADFLPSRGVRLELDSRDKASVIKELVSLLCEVYGLDEKKVLEAVLKREEMMSTGVGYGVAIPHAKIEGITTPKLVGGLVREGLDFDSIDGRPAKIFFLLVSPREGAGDHVNILSELSKILNKPEAREEILAAGDAGEFIAALRRFSS